MGLDDVLPDGVSKGSSQSRGGGSSGGSDEEDKPDIAQTIQGSGDKAKRFTEEKWEEVKEIIRKEYPYTVNEVLNNLPAQERYKIVHEAALYNDEEKKKEELEEASEQRCFYCDDDCSSGFVTLEGEDFCLEHTAGQVANSLDK